jgi:hypothetical protein
MTKATSTPTLLARDEYGVLELKQHLTPENVVAAKSLISKAVKVKNGVPAEYQSFGSKEYECLNHGVYDVQVVRGKVRGLVIQARYFWKHLRKTRTQLTKTYYLITSSRTTVTVEEIDNATVAKRAKNTTKLGQLVGHYQGDTPVKCAPKKPISIPRAPTPKEETNDKQHFVYFGSRCND